MLAGLNNGSIFAPPKSGIRIGFTFVERGYKNKANKKLAELKKGVIFALRFSGMEIGFSS